MKKTTAVILAILLIIPISLIMASAGTEEILTDTQIEQATKTVLLAYVGADEDSEIIIDEEFTADFDSKLTAEELAEELDSVVLVEATQENEKSVAEKIADECIYTVTVLDDGKKTVYIAVDLEKNPELFELNCLQEAVYAMTEKQKDYVEGEEEINLLTYTDIAGELALHMIVYAVLDPVNESLPDKIKSLYNSAKIADLNIDESRIPRFIIEFIGTFLMDVLSLFS